MADCGPGNAISQMSKNAFNETRKQEHMAMEQGPSRLYQRNQNDAFLQERGIVENLEMEQHRPMDGLLRGPVPLLMNPQVQQAHHWTREFDQHQAIYPDHQQVFEKAFPTDSVLQQPQFSTGFQPYRPMNHVYPQVHHEMSAAMNSRNLHSSESDESWAEGFKSAQERAKEVTEKEINGVDSADALAKTAGVIADIMNQSGNEKFKNSKFFGLMNEIRDKKVAIEGDKIVEQIEPAQSSYQKAQEFLGENVKTASWEEDFSMEQGPSQVPHAPPRNWNQDFLDEQLKSQYKPDVSHDMDIPSHMHNLEQDSVRERELYENDWTSDFREKMTLDPNIENEEMWKKMEETYDAAYLDGQDYSREFSYNFTQNNPYASLDADLLRSPSAHTNLTESILATEALIQKGNANAHDWFELGRKQQENENDPAAIAALQRALEADPNYLPAYLTLAVSQTNENLTNEGYRSLTEWLNRNPKYPNITYNATNTLSSSDYHDGLIQHLLQAAMSKQEFDPEVQTALGILFNISSEYEKAIDCFQAALSANPDDYQLWNKLGATLANSGDSEKAMEAYFNALQINSSYIRVRYNLAIACMQMGQHKEAAGYLLSALSIQEKNLHHVMQKAIPELLPEMRQIQTEQSTSVWNALRLVLTTYMRRDDLVNAVDAKDLNAFRNDFEF